MNRTLWTSILLPWVLRRGTHRAICLNTSPLWRMTSATPVLSRARSSDAGFVAYLRHLKRKYMGAKDPPYNHACQVGHPVLRSRAAEVEPGAVLGEEVQKVISTLVKVMRKRECVGLSAPQIGVPMRIFVAEYTERMLEQTSPVHREACDLAVFPLRVFINPRLRVCDSRTVTLVEACESIAGFAASVPRNLAVEVSGLNEKAEPVTWQVSGWPARILQHEMDHLDGVLYIDRMDRCTFTNRCWEEHNK
ncbi:hypothetical protein AGOR_G00169330 [Albula goreensis]|uniref:Peptide deformylase n=1 Tax=Albula goreensis TaxID=1534307 RepID=A0A8T3D276_9TELE|nr:hypothetical protein AGOR_G00169330 [Albula goreensis]